MKKDEPNNVIEWDNRYALGIPLIDDQHKKLIDMANKLYVGCLSGDETARAYFMNAIREAVDYVRYHFSTEENMLARIKYPGLAAHKKEHEAFVKEIIRQVGDFRSGKKFVPNIFVRYLRDWVLTHIALSDKLYADYLVNLKKEGTLLSLIEKSTNPAAERPGYGCSL
jgi:hemerythrin